MHFFVFSFKIEQPILLLTVQPKVPLDLINIVSSSLETLNDRLYGSSSKLLNFIDFFAKMSCLSFVVQSNIHVMPSVLLIFMFSKIYIIYFGRNCYVTNVLEWPGLARGMTLAIERLLKIVEHGTLKWGTADENDFLSLMIIPKYNK